MSNYKDLDVILRNSFPAQPINSSIESECPVVDSVKRDDNKKTKLVYADPSLQPTNLSFSSVPQFPNPSPRAFVLKHRSSPLNPSK